VSNWRSRKLWVSLIAYVAAITGFVYAFIYASDEVMLAAIAVIGLISGGYNIANAFQARRLNGNGGDNGVY
jgi:hypothetical protein